MGVFAAVFSLLSGAGQVIVVDPSPVRLKAAEAVGVDHTIDAATPEERLSQVLALTQGRGADVVIEASGNPFSVGEGMNMTRDSGTFTIVGQYTDAGEVSINPHLQINKKHLDTRGVWGSVILWALWESLLRGNIIVTQWLVPILRSGD